MKVLTTNIWRYYEWGERKNKAIKFLKEQDADLIFLQEVAYDERLKNKWSNQVEEINEQLGYKDSIFGKLMKMDKWHGETLDRVMYYGFGMLSKYPIKSSEIVILPPVEKKKDFGFMHVVIETPKGNVDLINVNLENTNLGSKEQLKKTLQWCKKKEIKPIIAGDFNMKIIEDLKEVAEETYHISYLIKPYISFMPTEFSHDKKPITLDYILCHKERFNMENIECINNDISDHNPVVAEIEIK